MQRNSYGAYGIFVTATAKRQRQNGNGRVETRHYPMPWAVAVISWTVFSALFSLFTSVTVTWFWWLCCVFLQNISTCELCDRLLCAVFVILENTARILNFLLLSFLWISYRQFADFLEPLCWVIDHRCVQLHIINLLVRNSSVVLVLRTCEQIVNLFRNIHTGFGRRNTA